MIRIILILSIFSLFMQMCTLNTKKQVVASTRTTEIPVSERSYKITDELMRTKNFYIPSSFTPNNDGKDDYFYVKMGEGIKQVKSLTIYNRWGQPLFETKNIVSNNEKLWDGTLKGQKVSTNESLYYTLKIEFKNGLVESYTGTVILLSQ